MMPVFVILPSFVQLMNEPVFRLEIGLTAVNLGAWRVAAKRLARYETARPGQAETSLLLGRCV